MPGAAEAGGTIGIVTGQADQPATTGTESPSAERAAADPVAADGGAADVPAAIEAPDDAPDTTAGVAVAGAPDSATAEEPAEPATTDSATAEEPADTTATDSATAEEPADTTATDSATAEEPADTTATDSATAEEPAEPATTDSTTAEEPAEPATTDSTTAEEPADTTATERETAGETVAMAATEPAAAAAPETSGADAAPPAGHPAPAADDRSPGIGTPIPSAATTGGLTSGDIISGVVSSVERRELELDLGSGRTGVIGSRHWSAGLEVDLTVEAKVGDIVEAAVLVREDHKQRIVLSRSWGRQQRAWETAENARKTGEIISGTVTDAVAAGLTVDIGIRAFVPASMAGEDDPESLVGTAVECKVTEVNQLKGRCILSRKAALRTRERQAARKRLADLAPGTMVRARITKVEDFGALVLAEGDLRGRIRRSELSWFRVRRPGDVVSVGDELEARVLHTTPAKMSLDLSLRIGDDPLAGISPGERHQATVTSLAPFGAFVTVGDGIRGLVPTAELSEHPIRHPRDVVVPGDSVMAEVTKVDRQRRDLEFSVNLAVLVQPSGAE